MKISISKRIKSLELFFKSDCSYKTFASKWDFLFKRETPPNRKYMFRLLAKFRKYGTVGNVPRTRQRPCRSEEIVTDVSAYFHLNQGSSLNTFIKDGGPSISRTTVHTILRDDLGLKPYKCRKFHKLNGQSDYNQRYKMCKFLTDSIHNDSSILYNIIWTDECFIKLNDVRNYHNIYWWTKENPHIFVEQSVNAKGVMVFVAITAYGPIGPYFFDELISNADKKIKTP